MRCLQHMWRCDGHRTTGPCCAEYRASGLGSPRCEVQRDGQCGSLDDSRDVHQRDRTGDLYPLTSARGSDAVRALQQQAIESECKMLALWKRVRSPAPYLLILLLGVLWAAFDTTRDPARQLLAHTYLWGIRVYQQQARPMLEGRVQCRYNPSCSEYSSEAIQRFGLGRGLALTARRISRCRSSVPFGTKDPVPMMRLQDRNE